MGTGSVNMKEAEAWAKKYDATAVFATDPRSRRAVLVMTDEGGMHMFQNAFVLKKIIEDDIYYCVFPEHESPQCYHIDEAKVWQYSERMTIDVAP